MMSKSIKLKCRYCGSGDLHLEQNIILQSDVSGNEEDTFIYEKSEYCHDKLIEEFACYCCGNCGRNLTIDDEYRSDTFVNEDNLEEYCQKYCS